MAICKPRHWNRNWNWNWYYKRYNLHFHKAYGPQTYQGGDLVWGNSTHSHVTIQHRDHVTNKKRYISTFTRPMDPKSKALYLHIYKVYGSQNFARCWFTMRRPYAKSHIPLRSCRHVAIQKRHISSTTRPMIPKLSRMRT